MYLTDRLPIASRKHDSDGNLIVRALAARTGIQDYAGYELGRPDMAVVRLYRPEDEVFNRDSLRSYAGRPVTIEHPPVSVTTDNWKEYAVGETGSDDIVRDGESVAVPFILRDAAGIAAVDAGKREISMGYTAEIEWAAGQTNDGQPYDAIQRSIRINHLAIVDKARGGPELRIGDSDVTTKPFLFDGLTIQVTDAAEQAIVKLQGQLADAQAKVGTVEASLATANSTIETKDGEIAGLKTKLEDAEKANNPAALQALADARNAVIGKAKAIAPKLVFDGKDMATIKAEAVTAKLGDSVKDKSPEYIDGVFDSLTSGVKPCAVDAVAAALTDGVVNATELSDAQSAQAAAKQARLDRLNGVKTDK